MLADALVNFFDMNKTEHVSFEDVQEFMQDNGGAYTRLNLSI